MRHNTHKDMGYDMQKEIIYNKTNSETERKKIKV